MMPYSWGSALLSRSWQLGLEHPKRATQRGWQVQSDGRPAEPSLRQPGHPWHMRSQQALRLEQPYAPAGRLPGLELLLLAALRHRVQRSALASHLHQLQHLQHPLNLSFS